MELSKSALHPKDREARCKTRIQRTLDELVPISVKIALLIHAASNRSGLAGLTIGMELEDTKQHMGERTRTGSSGYFTNIVLENPHWYMTFFNKKEEKIEVLYYLTEICKLDEAYTPRQFTPVLFVNNRLKGWGWRSLQKVKKGREFEIECRRKLLKNSSRSKRFLNF